MSKPKLSGPRPPRRVRDAFFLLGFFGFVGCAAVDKPADFLDLVTPDQDVSIEFFGLRFRIRHY